MSRSVPSRSPSARGPRHLEVPETVTAAAVRSSRRLAQSEAVGDLATQKARKPRLGLRGAGACAKSTSAKAYRWWWRGIGVNGIPAVECLLQVLPTLRRGRAPLMGQLPSQRGSGGRSAGGSAVLRRSARRPAAFKLTATNATRGRSTPFPYRANHHDQPLCLLPRISPTTTNSGLPLRHGGGHSNRVGWFRVLYPGWGEEDINRTRLERVPQGRHLTGDTDEGADSKPSGTYATKRAANATQLG